MIMLDISGGTIMPDYEPLTQQEKQAIIDRHHFLVDKMNVTLGGVLKYEDEAILQKLEDPKQVAAYRMFQEQQRRNAKREALMDSLKKKYGPNTITSNPASRTFKFMLRLGDDPKDVAYNEKIYQEYISHPEKLVYRSYSKLLNLNPKQIYDLGNDKQAMAEFYMENTELCESAYSFAPVLNAQDSQTTRALKKALVSMAKPFETLNELGNVVKTSGIEYLAFPTMTQEQTAMSMMTRELFQGNPYPDLTEVVNQKLGAQILEKPHDYFQHFIDKDIDINEPDFLVKYKAMRRDPETGERTEVSFDAIFVQHDPNAYIDTRSPEEMFQIKCVNKVFQDQYAQKFQSRIATKLNQMIFNVNQLEEEHKGGWFERNILHSTSVEWTEFIEAFKQFNDPEHPNYLRKDVLRPKAQAYLDHKHDQGYETLADMKGTSLKRGTFCQSVIDVCDELDEQEAAIKEDIDIQINTGLNGKVGLIINADQVDIFGETNVQSNEAQPAQSKEFDIDIDAELNESADLTR